MATSSFNDEFKIKDDKAAKAMIRASENPTASACIDEAAFSKELERGRLLLKKRYSP